MALVKTEAIIFIVLYLFEGRNIFLAADNQASYVCIDFMLRLPYSSIQPPVQTG